MQLRSRGRNVKATALKQSKQTGRRTVQKRKAASSRDSTKRRTLRSNSNIVDSSSSSNDSETETARIPSAETTEIQKCVKENDALVNPSGSEINTSLSSAKSTEAQQCVKENDVPVNSNGIDEFVSIDFNKMSISTGAGANEPTINSTDGIASDDTTKSVKPNDSHNKGGNVNERKNDFSVDTSNVLQSALLNDTLGGGNGGRNGGRNHQANHANQAPEGMDHEAPAEAYHVFAAEGAVPFDFGAIDWNTVDLAVKLPITKA